ncbi:MAG: DUF6174 domain-containing protein [Thermomicrobiales bacterium]
MVRRVLLGCVLLVVFCAGCNSSRSGTATVVTVAVTPTAAQTVVATATAPASIPVSTNTPVPTPSAPAATAIAVVTASAPSLDRLNDAERTWQASGVTHYQIRSHYEGEVYVDATMEIEVDKGQTTKVTCSSQPRSISACSSSHSENYTVSGLFQRVRQAINDPGLSVNVMYDPIYGFPRSFSIQSRGSTAGGVIVVESFVVLP